MTPVRSAQSITAAELRTVLARLKIWVTLDAGYSTVAYRAKPLAPNDFADDILAAVAHDRDQEEDVTNAR